MPEKVEIRIKRINLPSPAYGPEVVVLPRATTGPHTSGFRKRLLRMDLNFDKYISNLYRPDLISSGLNTALGKARGLMGYFRLSQEDLLTAGIILDDEGRQGKDEFSSTGTRASSPGEGE